MGAYLNKPQTQKLSEDDCFGRMKYGASSMQGWRISQEDAHNCCLNYNKDASLFAVYDGHGGSEVADYTAEKLPDFIKSMPAYSDGKTAEALELAFLQFDGTLVEDEVIETLKELAGMNAEDEEEDDEETEKLTEEADMPMEELMRRYGYLQDGESTKPMLEKLRNIRKEDIKSPMIRAKKDPNHINGDDAQGNEDIKLKLDDQLVNGHTEKMAGSIPTPDSTNSSEAKSEMSKLSSISKADSSNSDVICSSSDSAVMKSDTDHSVDAGVSSSTIEVSSGGSSSVGSSSSVDGCGSSVDGGVNSSGTAGGGSRLSDEPSSSRGQTRKKRSGVIPEEDEDESSFDEDEEDTDEEEDSDEEAEPWKSGSDEDESEEDDEGVGPFMEQAEDDEEEEEVMTGGEDDDNNGPSLDTKFSVSKPGRDSGCTAVVALLQKSQLYVANAGDSRCVLCRSGKAIDLSLDHKPEDDIERTRIEKAGGRITKDGRVNGGLNLSRAIGDHCYKQNTSLPARDQMITALPDIRTATIEEEDEFMVLACDGIWNVMSSQDVITFIRDRLKAGVSKLSSICEEMFDMCLSPDTYGDGTGCDNMTCIIVTFGDHFPTSNEAEGMEAKPSQVKNAEISPEIKSSECSDTSQSTVNSSVTKSDHSATACVAVDSSDAEPGNTSTVDADCSTSKRKAADDSINSSDSKKIKTAEVSSND